MTPWILGALGLWLLQTFYAASFRTFLADDMAPAVSDHLRGKDAEVGVSVQGRRAERAQRNLLESLVVFVPLALLLEVRGISDGLAAQGAILFLAARVMYVPAYHLAIFGLRSTVWFAGFAGLGMMASALL